MDILTTIPYLMSDYGASSEIDRLTTSKFPNMANILLFGLSADMPHYGHIKWIDKLKKIFPEHIIVIMPCCANPLGKTDESGKIIYPTNGYLRWQMLYDFYKEYDQDIIVSQYEVSINTPSTTIVTINYLMHTCVSEIKKQRGHDKRFKPQKIRIKNNITLAIGSELFNELPLWHDWHEILNLTNIVIMNRSGYSAINPQNIENLELKRAFVSGIKDGSIRQLDGPKIKISSRELKKLIRNGASDEELLPFIPESILKFIRNNLAEFSVAYYQNLKAREVYELAMQIYQYDLDNYDLSRDTIFRAYISALKNEGEVDHWHDLGYKIKNSRLIVDLKTANHQTINQIISNYLQKSENPWFKTDYPLASIIAPRNFKANFKVLGNFGVNLATDAIIFIKYPDSELKILSILRKDDLDTKAIPGGFNESNVFDTCIYELLEECFSNALFTENSISSELIDKEVLDYAKVTKIKNAFNKICLEFINSDIYKVLDLELQKVVDLKPSVIIQELLDKTYQYLLNDGVIFNSILAKLKVACYQILLPNYFDKFKAFIFNNCKIGPEELSTLDERNTNLAWISTQTIRLLLNEKDFITFVEECGLELSGGDDASSAKIVPVIDFCTSAKRPFASHAYLVLRDLSKMIEDGKIQLTDEFISKIRSKIQLLIYASTRNEDCPF